MSGFRLLLVLLVASVRLCRGQMEPTTVSEPLDFSGLASMRLPLLSQRGFSWTAMRYTLQGVNATDPYQPGRVIVFPGQQFFEVAPAPAYGAETAWISPEPGPAWHGRLSSSNTGAPFASDNLPPPATRGILQQSEHYHWFTQEGLQAGGPLGKRADLLVSGTGQWASQTVPTARAGQDLDSGLLLVNARGRVQPSGRDQLDALFSGSRVSLSDWGAPAGLEPLAGLRERDQFNSVQAGWTRQVRGTLQVRYAHLAAHLETTPTGRADPPPLANRAVRTRQELRAIFERHGLVVAGDWDRAGVRNRWSTPLDSRARIQSGSASVREKIRLLPRVSADLALVGDFARGSAGRIAWNSASPRVGIVITPPRMILRGNYARLYVPLAGRYLDFGNAGSLNEIERRSTIDGRLRRPYADEFNLGAEVALPLRISASLRLFRRDEKNRLAAVNVGVPAAAFSAVEVLDPGPDSLAGTFDDQKLTVYAQDPRTLGQDRYMLTNPAGLRMLNKGVVAELWGRWRSVEMQTSFMAVKSHGPTNPGNAVTENDSGVVGALFKDPNTLVNAAGRTFFDRAYVAKARVIATLPKKLGGIELANTANYLDGLAFGRRLLVTGLPQGPFLVAATVRGSPEGGNRAEYVLNWNLRLSRTLRVARGGVRLGVDVLNVTNAGNRVQEIDSSGPLFNQRLPVAIQSPRFVRFCLDYEF